MIKPGVRTSEFYITAALTMLASVVALLPEGSTEARLVLAILAGASVFGYNVSRGLAKSKAKQ